MLHLHFPAQQWKIPRLHFFLCGLQNTFTVFRASAGRREKAHELGNFGMFIRWFKLMHTIFSNSVTLKAFWHLLALLVNFQLWDPYGMMGTWLSSRFVKMYPNCQIGWMLQSFFCYILLTCYLKLRNFYFCIPLSFSVIAEFQSVQWISL